MLPGIQTMEWLLYMYAKNSPFQFTPYYQALSIKIREIAKSAMGINKRLVPFTFLVKHLGMLYIVRGQVKERQIGYDIRIVLSAL